MSTATQAKKPDFRALSVVSFESRMADLMQKNLERYGAKAFVAPSMQEIPLEKNPEVFAFADKLMRGEVDVLILLTGVGLKMMIKVLETKHDQGKILQALNKLTLVARGPKPVKVLKDLKLPVTIQVPEPNTWHEVLEELDVNKNGIELEEKNVAVQEYGLPNPELIAGLKERGANVIQVPVYRWALPDNREPLERAIDQIIAGEHKVAMFTNAMQVRHLIRLASEKGVEEDLRNALKKIVMASIGPTCTEAIREMGLQVDFEPSHPKMGHLISETAKEIDSLLDEKKGVRPTVELKPVPEPTSAKHKRKDSPFLKACRGEKTPYTPIWLMRQAGRYMKEYRKIRGKVSFLELCRSKELVAEVTIYAQEALGVDAAIIFSDILLIVEPLGCSLEFAAGDGPVISGKVVQKSDIDQLNEVNPKESLGFVMDGIELTRASLAPEIPLIGFSAAPFTLASYMVEGGGSRVFLNTKKLMYSDFGAWDALMSKVARALIAYLKAQVDAGVDCLQIFDSWVGCLSPHDYEKYVMPYTKQVIEGVGKDVPVIHFGTGTSALLELMQKAGGDVIGVDFRVELDAAWKRLGKDARVQGNLDPALLCGDEKTLLQAADRILKQAAGRPGHIFNLGHGIMPQTPVENVKRLVEYVHEKSQSS